MLTDFSTLLKQYNCSVTGIIHVGAHDGGELPVYLQNGITKVIFFEPLPDIFKTLEENIKNHSDVKAYNCALGSKQEEKSLNISNNLYSSSLLAPKKHLEIHREVTFTQNIQVPVKTLDSFEIKNYNFLNMDVQGYELEVLRGGTETLKQIDYIFTEINFQEVYENCVLDYQLDSFLKEYNFTRVATFNGVPGFWGDAFYVKNV